MAVLPLQISTLISTTETQITTMTIPTHTSTTMNTSTRTIGDHLTTAHLHTASVLETYSDGRSQLLCLSFILPILDMGATLIMIQGVMQELGLVSAIESGSTIESRWTMER